MPRCDAIQRFTHDFDVDFPVPSKSYCQRRNEFMPSRSVPCRLVVHDGAGSLLRIPDSWDGTRLHPPGYWKRARVIADFRWCWPILESSPRHEPLMGKSLCQPSVATFLRGDGAPGGDKKRQKSSDSSIFSQWIPAIPSPLLLVLRGFTMFYMGF